MPHCSLQLILSPVIKRTSMYCIRLRNPALFTTTSYLGKVANSMEAMTVHIGHDIEQKRIGVIVQSFMIQEHFGKKTEILGICLTKTFQT